MSGNSHGSVLGASTVAGSALAATGAPAWVSFVAGVSIFAALLTLYGVSKFVNKH